MRSPVRNEGRPKSTAALLDPEVLDREGRALLHGEMGAVARGDFAEALRLNSLRLELAEHRNAELLRRLGGPAAPREASGAGRARGAR